MKQQSKFVCAYRAIAVVCLMPGLLWAGQAWSPAVYRGLVMGKSTKQELVQKLGQLQSTGREEDMGVPILSYETKSPLPGTLVVYVRRGIVQNIELNLKNAIPIGEAKKLFGADFRIVHYSFDDCLGDGGTAPIYEDPNGAMEELVSPSHGLVLHLNQYREVDTIIYLAEDRKIPKQPRCKSPKR